MILKKTNSIYNSMKKNKIGIDCESRNNPRIYGQLIFEKGAKTVQ